MSALRQEQVTAVHHWTDTLFTFRTTRNPGFRFQNGQFVMAGLEIEGKPLLRAYSIASANHEDHLEFFSIKVPDGPLTSRLQHIKVGDIVLTGSKPTGTLVLDNVMPGRNLYLMATGTGLAPFLSIIKDPETYACFDKVILVHGCRHVAELAYDKLITEELPQHEFLSELVVEKLIYHPTVTREAFRNHGRVTELVTTSRFFEETGLDPIDAAHDRMMICGSPAMLKDLTAIVQKMGFTEGNSGEPGQYVIEKAFVEK